MALYEIRTYTLYVGKMAEATKLYQELGVFELELVRAIDDAAPLKIQEKRDINAVKHRIRNL